MLERQAASKPKRGILPKEPYSNNIPSYLRGGLLDFHVSLKF